MATVEEKIVGFQVVRTLNRVQALTLDVAGRLKAVKDDAGAEKLKVEAAAACDSNTEKICKLNAFLAGYGAGQATLTRAYQYIGVTPKQVADETQNMESVQAATKQTLEAAQGNMSDMTSAGNEMHDSVAGYITEIADEELHYEPIQMQVVCWDLVNAVAITLQGLSQGTGQLLKGDSVETRQRIVERHLKTFSRARKYLDDSEESESYKDAVKIVADTMKTHTTTEQLTSLGKLVDAMVPRIPLVRRTWQYDGETVRNNPS